MDFFMPKDCSIDLVTPYWLLAALALLALAGVALLAQVVMLWRREARAGVTRWGRLPARAVSAVGGGLWLARGAGVQLLPGRDDAVRLWASGHVQLQRPLHICG